MDSPRGITRANGDHFRDEGLQFLQPGAVGDHDDDGDRQIPDVLLIPEALVHRDEDIEPVVRREARQVPVRASGPAHLAAPCMSGTIRGNADAKPPRNGLIQQNPHGRSQAVCDSHEDPQNGLTARDSTT